MIFGLSTVQQLDRSTEQQHVGWGFTGDVFRTNRVRGVLGQLLLDDTLVEQFKEQVEYLNVAHKV